MEKMPETIGKREVKCGFTFYVVLKIALFLPKLGKTLVYCVIGALDAVILGREINQVVFSPHREWINFSGNHFSLCDLFFCSEQPAACTGSGLYQHRVCGFPPIFPTVSLVIPCSKTSKSGL
jgi:hypothetical protein